LKNNIYGTGEQHDGPREKKQGTKKNAEIFPDEPPGITEDAPEISHTFKP
jgi:hypothetical protein